MLTKDGDVILDGKLKIKGEDVLDTIKQYQEKNKEYRASNEKRIANLEKRLDVLEVGRCIAWGVVKDQASAKPELICGKGARRVERVKDVPGQVFVYFDSPLKNCEYSIVATGSTIPIVTERSADHFAIHTYHQIRGQPVPDAALSFVVISD